MLGFTAVGLVSSALVLPLALRIHDIQGSAHASPFVGTAVSAVSGVVTAVAPSAFYMQDDQPDDDDATSEAVRVHTEVPVRAGDRVSVDGVVRESRFGCSACGPRDGAYANLATTEIDASAVVVVAHADELPEPVAWVAARARALPPDEDSSVGAIDVEASSAALVPTSRRLDRDESLEGMRVVIDAPTAAGPLVLVAGARELAFQAVEDGEAVMVSGALGVALPDVSRGDLLAGAVTGVLDYRAGRYVLLATAPLPRVSPARPAPLTPVVAPDEDELSVGTLNVQNFSAASPPAKREGLAAVIALDMGAPDLVVLQEVQDDSGARDDGTTASELTASALVSAIRALGGPPYRYRDLPPADGDDGGEPGGNIRVGVLVRTDRALSIVERSSAQVRAAEPAQGSPLRLRESPARVAPAAAAFVDSRKPLAIELRLGEETLFLVGCHFVSQLADAPRYGRFQPAGKLSRPTRMAQAAEVADLVAGLLAREAGASVLVVGDLNDVPQSAAIQRLRDSGLRDVLDAHPIGERMTHVYDGRGEALDHVLASAALSSRLIEARVVHGFAGHAHAPTDHDPIVARFRVSDSPAVSGGRSGCTLASVSALEAGDPWPMVAAVWAVGVAGWRRRAGPANGCRARTSRV